MSCIPRKVVDEFSWNFFRKLCFGIKKTSIRFTVDLYRIRNFFFAFCNGLREIALALPCLYVHPHCWRSEARKDDTTALYVGLPPNCMHSTTGRSVQYLWSSSGPLATYTSVENDVHFVPVQRGRRTVVLVVEYHCSSSVRWLFPCLFYDMTNWSTTFSCTADSLNICLFNW